MSRPAVPNTEPARGWWAQYEERAETLDIIADELPAGWPETRRSIRAAADDIRTLVDGLRQFEREALARLNKSAEGGAR